MTYFCWLRYSVVVLAVRVSVGFRTPRTIADAPQYRGDVSCVPTSVLYLCFCCELAEIGADARRDGIQG